MSYFAGKFDIAVIGAGHAGIEAALASARLGCKTAVFTINMDAVGNCPCNPSIGGTAKGHLVREIDALGGEMGKTADECMLQMRMLNRGKGPAVHSLRAQIDRRKYSELMKHKLELQENLELHQAEIVKLDECGDVWKVTTRMGAEYEVKAVIIATGTYLGGRIYIGEVSYDSGPDGIFPALYPSVNTSPVLPAKFREDTSNVRNRAFQLLIAAMYHVFPLRRATATYSPILLSRGTVSSQTTGHWAMNEVHSDSFS